MSVGKVGEHLLVVQNEGRGPNNSLYLTGAALPLSADSRLTGGPGQRALAFGIPTMEEDTKDWKLKLRYGKLTTPFRHFTILADGIVGELEDGFECRPGRAWMALKAWVN